MDILEEVLLPTVRATALPAAGQILLVQDNSPVHKARIVTDWFSRHREFERLFWPARSPDFNPIEDIWATMANEWVNANERTSRDLLRHCRAVWESIRTRNVPMCENLVRSIPRRIAECAEAEGEHTH